MANQPISMYNHHATDCPVSATCPDALRLPRNRISREVSGVNVGLAAQL